MRPELSEIASLFLAQLTDGRYTALEIDDAYNILVLDEGEEKPVISGGEEDVANLVLRLSLSQMIAERAGHPLSLLILDEVFGSLDVARRDNVVQLLRRLEDRFEQVILITHIEGIRESLDQVLRVSFDERTGSSVVREESFLGTDDVAEGLAADWRNGHRGPASRRCRAPVVSVLRLDSYLSDSSIHASARSTLRSTSVVAAASPAPARGRCGRSRSRWGCRAWRRPSSAPSRSGRGRRRSSQSSCLRARDVQVRAVDGGRRPGSAASAPSPAPAPPRGVSSLKATPWRAT